MFGIAFRNLSPRCRTKAARDSFCVQFIPGRHRLPNTRFMSQGQTPESDDAPSSMPEMKPPKELISHYESQGMDSQQASMKVIEDLQKALRGVISSSKAENDKLLNEYSMNMKAVHDRLAKIHHNTYNLYQYVEYDVNLKRTLCDLEEKLVKKLDKKPGCFATFAIGIACAAALAFIRVMFNLFKEDLETHSGRVKVRAVGT